MTATQWRADIDRILSVAYKKRGMTAESTDRAIVKEAVFSPIDLLNFYYFNLVSQLTFVSIEDLH